MILGCVKCNPSCSGREKWSCSLAPRPLARMAALFNELEDFGQKVDLTVRIREILQAYGTQLWLRFPLPVVCPHSALGPTGTLPAV